ncbi:VOC family protein [Vogesella indigofera]|uniref:VOC family protein n=1 Tax=Vogesella indigofera TaxID=45465 RepID=A0ABT5I360_VOGIN|nr:VOC family protein [Vogesella indigofera]MDC7690539.1 VOC family protein [Vogesella indigofera]
MLTLAKIDHLHIKVNDTAKALDWYQRVLGMGPDVRYKHLQEGPHGVLMLTNPSASVRLALSHDEAAVVPAGAVAFGVSGHDFMEWLDRLAVERVVSRDGQTIARDSVHDHGFFCSVSFVDPFGNPYEIVSYDHTWLAGKLKLKRA